jgi:hypothetical protein
MNGGDRDFDGSGVGVGVELDVGSALGVRTMGVEGVVVAVAVGDCVPSGVCEFVGVGDDELPGLFPL